MATIRSIKVTGHFKYLWLKTVVDVNLNVHCARCLIGEYDERISARMSEAADIELPNAPYHYLCGVTTPYVWAENFHLAFVEKEGATLDVERHGIHIIIDGAEELPFSEADIDQSDPHARAYAYRTCRNWQFAHKISPLI